jgi:hypothetical protein
MISCPRVLASTGGQKVEHEIKINGTKTKRALSTYVYMPNKTEKNERCFATATYCRAYFFMKKNLAFSRRSFLCCLRFDRRIGEFGAD